MTTHRHDIANLSIGSVTLLSCFLLGASTGCGSERRATGQTPPKCEVVETGQALVKLFPFVVFSLSPEIGGLRCVPGRSEQCDDTAEACIGDFGATIVGEDRTATIAIENNSPVKLSITEIAFHAETCEAFSLEDAPGDVISFVDADTTEELALHFSPAAVGDCSARIDVVSDAGNNSDAFQVGSSSVLLRGRGVE